MENMFCFQCEQTAGGKGCAGGAGVCGKRADTSLIQDRMTGELIGLARGLAGGKPAAEIGRLVIEGLFAAVTNVNFDNDALGKIADRVRREREKTTAGAYDMSTLWNADEEVRSLRSLILFGLRGMAAYAYHALALGRGDDDVLSFIFRGLEAVGDDSLGGDELLPLVLETGKANLGCMEILDLAHNETYGAPRPTTVAFTIEKGPFIVVSGHDLHDLQLLLEQTRGQGINIYTHGEMLPAHAYPELKKHPHLKGNFGTAWQNQQEEFDALPAPALFTTNCLMPVGDGRRDRVFTTALVGHPGLIHIGPDKNFAPVIAKARELGGYADSRLFTGINGGSRTTTGFGHAAVLAAADKIAAAVGSGAIRRFFLVGGCDGAKPGRNYYTDFVKLAPGDTMILTLACGKYRFNDLDLGEIAGLPRLLDMGQCNDAYSAVRVASALAEAFGRGVNELPLTMVLSWYEQKAVCILLTLLHLGVRNILLGPSLPAFASPGVLEILTGTFGLAPITTPEKDLARIMGN